MTVRPPVENADTVSLVCALLARYPEIASIRAMPGEGTLRLTFAIAQRLDRDAQRRIAEAVDDHLTAYVELGGEDPSVVRVECESDRAMAFLHVARDLETFSKGELELLVAFLADRFGEHLVRSASGDRQVGDDDLAEQDEIAEYAIEALRDPTQSKNLVGFHEEQRVLVYFLKSRKRKASGRR
jgi:hypothetical protein